MKTTIFKKMCQFGCIEIQTENSLNPTTRFPVKSTYRNNIVYWSNEIPISRTWGELRDTCQFHDQSVGWFIAPVDLDDNSSFTSGVSVTPRFLESAIIDEKLTLRFSITNTTSEQITIKSFGYKGKPYCYSGETGSSISNSYPILALYYNMETEIVLAPSDVVILDVILESGDISEVSQG